MAVDALDADVGEEAARDLVPAGGHDARAEARFEGLCAGAVERVDLDGAVVGDEAHDFVAGNGAAALGKGEVALLFVESEDIGLLGVDFGLFVGGFCRFFRGREELFDLEFLVVATESEAEEARDERAGATRGVDVEIVVNRGLAAAEFVEKLLARRCVIDAEYLRHHAVVEDDVVLHEEVVEYLLTLLYDRLLDASQLLAQARLGLGGGEEGHPLRLGSLRVGREHLDLVA